MLFLHIITLCQVCQPGIFVLPDKRVENVFIITIDGFRWQELFSGADEALITNSKYTGDTALAKMMWWAPTATERRNRLLPFFGM